MKILHISSSDTTGGAAQSGMNLHTALLEAGVESVFFAAEKQRKGSQSIRSFKNGYFKRRLLAILDRVPLRFYPGRNKAYTFTNNWFPVNALIKAINKERPDIVHLHWVGKGMLRIEHLKRIRVPVVWTMHDNYVFTGGCHLVNTCEKYQSRCGACPDLASNKARDLSTWNFNRKKRTFPDTQITFIAPSRWMYQLSRQSALLAQARVEHLPNLLDPYRYFAVNKTSAKQGFAVEPGTKMVLYGAFNATGDVNKGFSELLEALNSVASGLNIALHVFGADKPEGAPAAKFPVVYWGYLSDTVSKRFLYSAADVTVVPSKIENLSNVIMESMACATPVVAFKTGGNSDLIDHLVNGFLAEKGNTASLSEGINWVLGHPGPERVQKAAQDKIREVFGRETVLLQHLSLYRSLVNER